MGRMVWSRPSPLRQSVAKEEMSFAPSAVGVNGVGPRGVSVCGGGVVAEGPLGGSGRKVPVWNTSVRGPTLTDELKAAPREPLPYQRSRDRVKSIFIGVVAVIPGALIVREVVFVSVSEVSCVEVVALSQPVPALNVLVW